MIRIGVDTGGTFTDFVVADSNGIRAYKVPSTPEDPACALIAAIRLLSGAYELSHGTTVATNAILEGKGARTALILNEGFRDLVFLGRQTRPDLYALEPVIPSPPICRNDCFTVKGRLDRYGSELSPLEIGDVVERVKEYESVAVCLLFSYANPAHEIAIARSLLNKFVSPSHAVSPEFREYERACATLINAYVDPLVSTYFNRIANEADRNPVRVMMSSGGLAPIEQASERPLQTITSGPAAGAIAAKRLAESLGVSKAIAFDVGGTSTDVTLINRGLSFTSLSEIAGIPVRLHRVAVHTIGCGGGSSAHIDAGGALTVGPESAGATPGPALYGKGDLPTLTDANFVLGRLPISQFGGGSRFTLNPEASIRSISVLAKHLGTTVEAAAKAIVAISVAQMARAIRNVSSQRGHDPAEFALIPFGGAGPLHACEVADELAIRRILVPTRPGVFSALGLLLAPIVEEASETVIGSHRAQSWDDVYADLLERARGRFRTEIGRTIVAADMRYRGQSYELTVPAEGGLDEARRRFESEHERTFGVLHHGEPIEWVTARVRLEHDPPELPRFFSMDDSLAESEDGNLSRFSLSEGAGVSGPTVLIQSDSTIYIAEGWRAESLEDGTLQITK